MHSTHENSIGTFRSKKCSTANNIIITPHIVTHSCSLCVQRRPNHACSFVLPCVAFPSQTLPSSTSTTSSSAGDVTELMSKYSIWVVLIRSRRFRSWNIAQFCSVQTVSSPWMLQKWTCPKTRLYEIGACCDSTDNLQCDMVSTKQWVLCRQRVLTIVFSATRMSESSSIGYHCRQGLRSCC